MFKSSFLPTIFLSVLTFVISVNGYCVINVENVSPLFKKSLGNKELQFQKEPGIIKLLQGETIDAHCSSGIFFGQSMYSSELDEFTTSMSIHCNENNIIFYKALENKTYKNDSDFDTNLNSRKCFIKCEGKLINLYLSKIPLVNCAYEVTYAIGTSIPYEEDTALIGICYNLEALNTRYATYIAYLPDYGHNLRKKVPKLAPLELTTEISNLNTYITFMSANDFTNLATERKARNELLRLYEFDYASLIQDGPLSKNLTEFENLINIIWWRNLRLGSWKFYLDALEEFTKTKRYLVYTGTSGEVTMPSYFDKESENPIFGIDVVMPKYIWSYLLSNSTQSFILIGINTPFYQINDSKELCNDMCDEIDWLKNSQFGKVRLTPTFGVVVCCRAEEVFNKLKDFPYQLVLQKSSNKAVNQLVESLDDSEE